MATETIGDRVRMKRESLGWNQSELARRCGGKVKPQNIQQLEDGTVSQPRYLARLAIALDTTERYLLTGNDDRPASLDARLRQQLAINDEPSAAYLPRQTDAGSNTHPGPDTRGLIPVISWVQAGEWHEAEDHFLPGDADDWRPCPASHGLHTYALRVEGESMTATHGKTYPDGSIIFVDPDQAGGVSSGDRVIAKINGEPKVTFKVFVEEAGKRFLRPLNPQYPIITDPFRIIGKVIGKWEDE